MEDYWNKLTLDRPPTNSWQCSSHEFNCKDFLKAMNSAIQELESQKILQTEAALLSRLIYRMKSKFRSDKGLKNMEKVNRALLNYLKLSLESDYKYLKNNTECEGDILALPSRQMLEYALVRTQGFAKLMCRIENVAKCAGDFFKARIGLGQAWNVSIVAYAVVSRIWLLARYLTKKSCDWYSRMYKYLEKLTTIGVPWLPQNYLFPQDLKKWLCVPWIDEDIKGISEQENLGASIFKLITKNEEAAEDLEIDLDQTNPSPPAQPELIAKKEEPKVQIEKPAPPSSIEVGERISREAFAADLAKQATKISKLIGKKEEPKVQIEKPARSSMEIGERISREAFAADLAKQTPKISKLIAKKDEPKVQIEKPARSPMEIGERISREAFAADLANQTTKMTSTKKRKNVVAVVGDGVVPIPPKRKSEMTEKSKNIKKNKVLSVNNLETTKDVAKFLSLETYRGLDKMQWKLVKKNAHKLLLKLNKCETSSGAKKQEIIVKKVIQALQEWIHL